MFKKVSCIFVFCIFLYSVSAQNVYQLKWAKDAPIAVSTIGIGTAGFFLNKNKHLISEAEVLALDASSINKFDRSAINNWNPRIAKVSDVGMFGSMALPALLFIDKNVRNEYGSVLAMWSETLLSTMAVTSLTKNIVQRKRPYLYNPNVSLSEKLSKGRHRFIFFRDILLLPQHLVFLLPKYLPICIQIVNGNLWYGRVQRYCQLL